MKRLSLKFENCIMSRVFLYLGIGLAFSALTAYVLTAVPDYRNFLYVLDAEKHMVLSTGGWVLFLLPLMMFLAMPQDFRHVSTGAVFIIYFLFCCLIGAAVSGISTVYIKADIAGGLFVTAAAFAIMAWLEKIFRKDLMSWHCIVMTALIGFALAIGSFFLFAVKLTDLTATLATIVVFCSMTAYSGYQIQKEIETGKPHEPNKTAVKGALLIYLNLVGLALKTIRFERHPENRK